jgi:hypothetical protein
MRRRSNEATRQMVSRFEAGVTARGLMSNMTGVSTAVKFEGRALGKTFLRDILKRKSGNLEFIEAFCRHWGISWDYVKFNKGPVLVSSNVLALPASLKRMVDSPPLEIEHEPSGGLIEPFNVEQLTNGMTAALQAFGASPEDAARVVKIVLATSHARLSHRK